MGQVIQGFFLGAPRLAAASRTESATQNRAGPARIAPGPPVAAFQSRGGQPVQRHAAPGRPPLAHAGTNGAAPAGMPLQRFGGDGSFAIDPAQVGLVRNGGKPLPQALLAKMEAAFGADFSVVRVHVGPQASRIGALAFTTGNDIYFAQGQYQPDSVKGQQLIGHELAHVIQQRQGRVRAPGNGVAVVQDRALEMEADRLGMLAASRSQANCEVTRFAAGAPSGAVQRSSASTYQSVTFGKGGRQEAEFVTLTSRAQTYDQADDKLEHLAGKTVLERPARSYAGQREIQILRWISTLIFELLEKKAAAEESDKYSPVEIQAYWHTDKYIYISSNKRSVNSKYLQGAIDTVKEHIKQKEIDGYDKCRSRRHAYKLIKRDKYAEQTDIFTAFVNGNIKIPLEVVKHDNKKVDLHAERRIQKMLGIKLDPARLAGVKRPCLICAYALDMTKTKNPGPGWTSGASVFGYKMSDVLNHAVQNGVLTYVARDRYTKKLTTGHDSDSGSGDDTY